jgi:carboxyl-terminal processing protease
MRLAIRPLRSAVLVAAACAFLAQRSVLAQSSATVKPLSAVSDLTSFLSPADFGADQRESAEGRFVGIGIHIRLDPSGFPQIVRVMPNSPAKEAGLLAGDFIFSVDGSMTQGLYTGEVAGRITGEVGSPVRLDIVRRDGGGAQHRSVIVRRGIIPVPTIEEARVLPREVGYVRMNAFHKHSPDELRAVVSDLLDRGFRAFVLDLRWNAGGYVRGGPEAIEVRTETAPLLPEGTLVAVLINELTLGTAELLAAALQEHGRAKLVGEATGGRGKVARLSPMPSVTIFDNAELTRESLFTPRGQALDGAGVRPDLVVPMSGTRQHALREQLINSFLNNPAADNAQNHGTVSGDVLTEDMVDDLPLLNAVQLLLGEPISVQ